MTILELRILPPFAVGRLGASETPLENYDLELSRAGALGFRHIKPTETLRVDPKSGEIAGSYVPEEIRFRDGPAIRPLAPFLEVFARTSEDTLEPLTVGLLERYRLKPSDVKWSVEVGNLKVFRRTSDPKDRILASVVLNEHYIHALEGRCENFYAGKHLPLGSVQYIRPTRDFPEIRLRFTPAAGWVYGATAKRIEPDAFGHPQEVEDPIFAGHEDRLLYDTKKGTWRGFDDMSMPAPTRTNPAQIYAGYADPKSGDQISWGYLDDECDGIVSVAIQIDGRPLAAFARISAGPPTFAPDSIPIRTAADELEQALHGPDVDAQTVTLEEAEEIVRRAVESVRLMNTLVMNGNTVEGRTNAASTMARQDANDFSRFYEPIMTPTSVDSRVLQALHQSILAALRSGTGAWFARALRRPEEIGDLSEVGRRKMPAMMRGADGRYLTLTRRQIDTIVKNALGGMFKAGDGESG